MPDTLSEIWNMLLEMYDKDGVKQSEVTTPSKEKHSISTTECR